MTIRNPATDDIIIEAAQNATVEVPQEACRHVFFPFQCEGLSMKRCPVSPFARVGRFSAWLGSAFLILLCLALPAGAQMPQVAFDSNLAEGQQVSNTIRIIGFAITPTSAGYVEIAVD